MTNAVIVSKPTYSLVRYNEDSSIKLTENQFNALDKILIDSQARFVRINDRIIAVSSIKEIIKLPAITIDINQMYEDSGTNPLFREWCALMAPKPDFKSYVDTIIREKFDKTGDK